MEETETPQDITCSVNMEFKLPVNKPQTENEVKEED
jgi:hypothetical protein